MFLQLLKQTTNCIIIITSAPLACEVKLESMTDRPTNQPTNRHTDMRGHREVSIAIINNIIKISLILAMIVKLLAIVLIASQSLNLF